MSILRVGGARRKGNKRPPVPELDALPKPKSSRSVLLRSPAAAPPRHAKGKAKRRGAGTGKGGRSRGSVATKRAVVRTGVRDAGGSTASTRGTVCPRCGQELGSESLGQHVKAVHKKGASKSSGKRATHGAGPSPVQALAPSTGVQAWVCRGGTGMAREDLVVAASPALRSCRNHTSRSRDSAARSSGRKPETRL